MYPAQWSILFIINYIFNFNKIITLRIFLAVIAISNGAVASAADNRPGYPKQFTMSPKGVNIQTGRLNYSNNDISIGPLEVIRTIGDGAMFEGGYRSFGLSYPGGASVPSSGWTHNFSSGIYTDVSSSTTYKRVSVDGKRYVFKVLSDGNIVPGEAATQGMSLYQTGNQTVVVDHSGNQFYFSTNPSSSSSLLLQRSVYANGSIVTISYNSYNQPKLIVSSMGYALVFDYDAKQNVSSICGFNTAKSYISEGNSCADAVLKVSYGYDANGSHLTSVTDTTGGVTGFRYADVQTGNGYGANRLSCITIVNSSACALQNAFGDQPGDPSLTGTTNSPCCTKPDQVRVQTTGTGNVWHYRYQPEENDSDVPRRQCWPYWAYADMDDAAGRTTSAEYDRGYLVNISAPDGDTSYRYPNGCASGKSGTNPITVETRLPRPSLVRKPGGIREYYEYDLRGNVVRFASFPKSAPDPRLANGSEWIPSDPDLQRCCVALGAPSIPAGSTVIQATYLESYGGTGVYGQGYLSGCGSGPSDAKLCDKPQTVIDAAGGVTDYTYDAAHGGVLTETGPAVGGVRPQTRYTYVQRQAWIANAGGGYSPTGQYVWLLASKSSCRSGAAASGTGCALGTGDEIRTLYEYGPDAGPNNLILRGVVNDATGAALRTCYGYDWMGNKVSETKPRAGLGVCP